MPSLNASDTLVATRAIVLAFLAPVLVLWPMLSTLPIFSIVSDPVPSLANAVNLALLATGFWGFFAIWLANRYFQLPHVRENAPLNRKSNILRIGGYACLWTALYWVAAVWR